MVASRRKKSTRRPVRRNAPRAAVGNEAEARELELWIDNTRKLYDRKRAAEEALLKKVRSGRYDHALAPKMFMYVVAEGAKDYQREFGQMTGGFRPATRMMVAKAFVKGFEGESEFREAKASARAPKARKRPAAKRNSASRSRRTMTKADAVRSFREAYPARSFQYEGSRGKMLVDRPARRLAWSMYIDGLHRDRQITDHQIQTWGHPAKNW